MFIRILAIGMAASILAGSSAHITSADGVKLAQANPTSNAGDESQDDTGESVDQSDTAGGKNAQSTQPSSDGTIADATTAPTANLQEFLADTRPIESLSRQDLLQKIRAGRDLARNTTLSRQDKMRVRRLIRGAREQLKKLRGNAAKPAGKSKAGGSQSNTVTP